MDYDQIVGFVSQGVEIEPAKRHSHKAKLLEKVGIIENVIKERDWKKENVRILDLGCGFGTVLIFLSLQGYKVYGVEKDLAIVKKAKENFARFEEEYGKFKFSPSIVNGDYFAQDFKKAAFSDGSTPQDIDFVYCFEYSPAHLEKVIKSLNYMKKGAVFLENFRSQEKIKEAYEGIFKPGDQSKWPEYLIRV